jgi:hypothetical protein
MSDRYPHTPDDADQPRPRTGRAIALVAVVVVLVGVVVVLALRGAGVFGAGGTASSAPPTASGSGAAGSPAAGGSASPGSGSPGSGSAGASPGPGSSPAASGDPKPQPTRSPVPIRKPAEIQNGLTASIKDLKAVQGKAEGPGEVAGPAVKFTLVLSNSADRELPLNTTVVNVYYGKSERPASQLESESTLLPAAVGAGRTATAEYVYVIPRKSRDDVLITVDYSTEVSLVAFRGSVPR